MHIVHVFIEVKPDFIEAFKAASLANARASVKEPGIARFDVLQGTEQPAQFTLVEVYRTKDDPARHRETQHYQTWKATVAEMMAAPRTKKIYDNLFPDDEGWD
ncbi:MAG: antibiotic biosynthesis monooxygenase [Anaerolineaceae bacterium]|nr:antibiotic biosynthesis monooxygenase [Anaerolineaceae bacterium]